MLGINQKTLSVILAVLFGIVLLGGLVYRNEIRQWLRPEIVVTFPEGITSLEIDEILADAGITPRGSVAAIVERDEREGYLFPDTYHFREATDPEIVVGRLVATWEEKAQPLFEENPGDVYETIILASILEREVRDADDQRTVAGLLKKRLSIDMRLQVDATICYLKYLENPDESCYPLERVDFAVKSPYNTYLNQGLPPGPIGNPGVGALRASLDAQPSPYWFYLSDPATSRTIFSTTFEEHERNRVRYLKGGEEE